MRRVVMLFALTIVVFAMDARAQTYFAANLSGAQEVPANASAGQGFARATLNGAETELVVSMYYAGLTGTVTAAHIHAPAAAGANGPVVLNLNPATGATSGSLVGATFAVTPTLVSQLRAGLAYVNVHTGIFPGGEIRGQLLVDAPLRAALSGSQEVPVVSTSAHGSAVLSLNPATNQVLVSLSVEGLSAAATAGHLHQAPAGSNGPVVCTLAVPAQASVSLTDALCALTTPQFADLQTGNLYINIHTSNFPGGEVRGQIDIMMRDGFE